MVRLITTYRGADNPFDGDRILYLRSLPEQALVKSATVTLTPLTTSLAIAFGAQGLGDWGVQRSPATVAATTYWAIADLGTRRNLTAVNATREVNPGDGGRVTVQVDLGGVWAGIASDGTMQTTGKPPLVLKLSAAETLFPVVATQRLKLTAVRDDQGTVNLEGKITLTGVKISTFPTNVSVRVGDLPFFWTRVGELTAPATSPDFANILNAFLSNAQAQDGYYAIPLTFHSDAIAQMDITLEIDYVIVRPVLPIQLPEVSVTYGFSTLPDLATSLTTLQLPRGAMPLKTQTGATIRGEFPATRVAWGEIGFDSPTIPVLVAPASSLAQPFQTDREIALTGIDLPLANTAVGLAGLNVSIQADADGKPLGEVLTSAEVKVEKPLPGQSSWGHATLSAPFRIEKNRRYWLILQSQSGQAYGQATPGAAENSILHSSRDGGFSWRPATVLESPSPLAALFRLRDTPAQFSIPVQLQIGQGTGAIRRQFNEFSPLGRVEFNGDFAEKLSEYLTNPQFESPCGTGELLTNGNFALPPHSGATRRLFGFDAGIGSPITGSEDVRRPVDLSVERWLILSTPRQEPVTIDCAGQNPSRTSATEIVQAINTAMGEQIANYDKETGYLILNRPESARYLLVLPWRQNTVPQGWQSSPGAAGEIWRLKLPSRFFDYEQVFPVNPDDETILTVLRAAGNQSTDISQTVAVKGGCTYQLSFRFSSANLALFNSLLFGKNPVEPDFQHDSPVIVVPQLPAVPAWEMCWFDDSGRLISREGSKLSDSSLFSQEHGQELPQIEGFEAKLLAPTGAVTAQIRFIQPTEGVLFLEEVSFQPTLQTLSNVNFSFWNNQSVVGEPIAWTVVKGTIDRLANQIKGVILRGEGIDDAILTQQVAIAGGKLYRLEILAYCQNSGNSSLSSAKKDARIELHWQGQNLAATPVILSLDEDSFPGRVWTGNAPQSATSAEIRLIQPKGSSNLVVESVSLTLVDLISVPLIFLAETPGQLTISNWRVGYDLPTPPPSSPDPQTRTIMTLSGPFTSQSTPVTDNPSPEIITQQIAPENASPAIAEKPSQEPSKIAFLPLFLAILGSMMVLLWH